MPQVDLTTQLDARSRTIAIELQAVVKSFAEFCRKYVYIQDKANDRAIVFDLYPCQEELAGTLQSGKWCVVLKARQLGITWLSVAYMVWLVIVRRSVECYIVNQNQEYACGSIDRARFIYHHLPDWMRELSPLTTDNAFELSFGRVPTHSKIRSLAGTAKAGDVKGSKTARSVTADVILFDEASRIEGLRHTVQASEPTVEQSKGQLLLVSTSAGPEDDFHGYWRSAPKNRFTPVFFPWSAHPDRTKEWYVEQEEAHRDDPLYLMREYPETPDQAFMAAGGRCFPLFSRARNAIEVDCSTWNKAMRWYLGIDWGAAASAFACLLVAHDPFGIPALTVDPGCENTIREMSAWKYNAMTRKPEKVGKHTCDALRYLVISQKFNGHVHVQQEIYIERAAEKGFTHMSLASEARDMCGDRQIQLAVADRAEPLTIQDWCEQGIPVVAYKKPAKTPPAGDIEQGIKRINALIGGADQYKREQAPSRLEVLSEKLAKAATHNVEFTDAEIREISHTVRLREIYLNSGDDGPDDYISMPFE